MIRPVSASRPMCGFFYDRRVFVPCFSTGRPPAPRGLRPVLSTRRCNGSVSPPAPILPGRGASSVAARRDEVETLASETFDLALVDLDGPGMGGSDAVLLHRSTEPGTNRLPIVGLAAGASAEAERA